MPGISVNKIPIPFRKSGINWSSYWATLNADGNTAAFYDRTRNDGVVKDVNGVESIYWDLNVGNKLRGEEQSSGSIIDFAIYEITATQANFFYTGCQVGDIFPCRVVKTCDANNKVRRVLGNHLCQPDPDRRPVNGVFDGINDYMLALPFSYVQPATIYVVVRNIVHKLNSWIYSGTTLLSPNAINYRSPDEIRYTGDTNIGSRMILRDGVWGIIKGVHNGAGSKTRLNDEDETTGNYGSTEMGGFVLGANQNGTSKYSNIEFKSAILRIGDEPLESDTYINNGLNRQFDIQNRYNNGKLVITIDDSTASQYSVIYPLFLSKGISGTFYITPDWVGDEGRLSWLQILEMYNNGMDIQCHGFDHTQFTTLNEAQVLAQLQAVNDAFVANGLPIPLHTAYPYGATSADVALWVSSMRLSGRRVTQPITSNHLIYKDIYKDLGVNLFPIKYQLRSLSVDNISDDNMIILKSKIAEAQLKKAACTVYIHGASVAGGLLEMPTAKLIEMIDYAKSIGMDIITISDLYNISDAV